MLVRESLNFERGKDPKHTMGVGIAEQIKKFVDSVYPDLNYTHKDTFLIVCAGKGKLDYVNYLIGIGADVHSSDDYALRLAAGNGYADVVKVLLKAGANIHAVRDGALSVAASNDHTEVVKTLLDAGANVRGDNDAAIFLAARYGHMGIVSLLIKAGAELPLNNFWTTDEEYVKVVDRIKDWRRKEFDEKIVSERLNFERGKNPKSSMGIGLAARRVFKDTEDAAQWAFQFPEVCTGGEVKVKEEWPNFFSMDKSLIRYRLKDSNLRLRIAKWFKNLAYLENSFEGWTMGLKDAKDVLERVEKIIEKTYY